MVKLNRLLRSGIIAIALISFNSEAHIYTQASSLPRALSDFKLIRLFQIQSGDLLLASLNLPTELLNHDLQIRFKKTISIPMSGIYNLGASCELRTHEAQETSHNYLISALPHSQALTVDVGKEMHVQNIRVSKNQLRAELADQKTSAAMLDLTCSHPKIRDWTVTSFEIHNQDALELRSNIERDPAYERHSLKPIDAITHLNQLRGSTFNGYFGSGLPGTSGLQLLIGSNSQAFADNGNQSLWVGNHCAVRGLSPNRTTDTYTKDSKFAFEGIEINSEQTQVSFHFRNWGYSLESLSIDCYGDAHRTLEMTTAQVERDLNHAVHFYNK